MLENSFVLLLVAATTLIAYLLTQMTLRNPTLSVRKAIRRFVECVGASCVFLGANMFLGVAVVFLIRSITPRFVSVYVLDDLMLVILSAAQGILFRLWWAD